jgi:hypothetical protein
MGQKVWHHESTFNHSHVRTGRLGTHKFQAALNRLSKALLANWRTRPESKAATWLKFWSCHFH